MFRDLPWIFLFFLLTAIPAGSQVVELLDASGDGTRAFDRGRGVAIDASGNVYAVGVDSDNVFRIGPGGALTEILDATSGIESPWTIDVDPNGNVYVTGYSSNNVYRIATPGSCSTSGTPCTITEIIDETGDGVASLNTPAALAADAAGNVYVGGFSDNVFRIATPTTCSTDGTPCEITELADASSGLDFTYQMDLDGTGNLFVIGRFSDNLFRIDQAGTCGGGRGPCSVQLLLDIAGDGENGYDGGVDLALDPAGRLYTSADGSDNIFRISNPSTCATSSCDVTEIFQDANSNPTGVAVDGLGNLYYVASVVDEVRRISNPSVCSTSGTSCSTTVEVGPGSVELPSRLDAGASGFVVSGSTSDNVLGVVPTTLFFDGFESGGTSLWQ